jgi:biopolymer transport protein ExbD
MPKVKIPRKNVSLDMTAMCDMASLLLTFFILTAQFKPQEVVVVETPSSVSDTKLPDKDIVTLSIDNTGAVFFGIDNQNIREGIFRDMAGKYNVPVNEAQIKEFSLTPSIGLPIAAIPQYLNLKPEDRKKVKLSGVPTDSSRNELRDWITYARYRYASNEGSKLRLAIKGDASANYKSAKEVIATLQDMKINRFNLITNLEARPQVAGLAGMPTGDGE